MTPRYLVSRYQSFDKYGTTDFVIKVQKARETVLQVRVSGKVKKVIKVQKARETVIQVRVSEMVKKKDCGCDRINNSGKVPKRNEHKKRPK
jgi:hypothetical protein